MADIQSNILAFQRMQPELEAKHMGQWVLFFNDELVSAFNSFDEAANEAVTRYGRGPYLIKQVGEVPHALPASVMFIPSHA
jgi:hypothetical protein